MILNVSGRTDIVAFYTDWFMNRYKEGFVDVRNPFNKHLISRIYFEDVEAIVFCTKNPLPILDKIEKIDKPILFHVTITPYKKDIEPFVIDKTLIIDAVKKLSNILGSNRVVVRYDPILINGYYTLEYHLKAFDKLCSILEGYVETIIISFVDEYKNVKKNSKYLKLRDLTNHDYIEIGKNFAESGRKHRIKVQTCAEINRLTEFGLVYGECLGKELARELTGTDKHKLWKARSNVNCGCVEMVDIGYYNTCSHLCKYCYANYDESEVFNNLEKHDDNSSLLIGKIMSDDIVKVRKK